jgi:hypothetical protein
VGARRGGRARNPPRIVIFMCFFTVFHDIFGSGAHSRICVALALPFESDCVMFLCDFGVISFIELVSEEFLFT